MFPDKYAKIRKIIEYEVFFSAHGSAKDLERLAPSLARSDIFLPELIGWSPNELLEWNAVSAGLLTPRSAANRHTIGMPASIARIALSSAVTLAFFETIYRSHKPIAFIEVPEKHPLTARFVKQGTRGFRLGRKFSETLRNAEDHMRVIAAIDKAREDYEVAHLGPTVDSVLKSNNTLASKDNVKVLLLKGDMHTRTADLMEKSGKKVTRTFDYDGSMIYGFHNEALQRFAQGKKADVQLMARAVMEVVVFYPTVSKVTDNSRIMYYM